MPGVAVGVGERPAGCAFAPRCPQKVERCDSGCPARGDRRRQARALLRVAAYALSRPLRALERPVGAVGTSSPSKGSGPCTVGTSRSSRPRTCPSPWAPASVLRSWASPEAARRRSRGASPDCTRGGRPDLARRRFAGREGEREEARRRIQIVFQNPFDSLNPRHRVDDAIARPARMLRDLSSRGGGRGRPSARARATPRPPGFGSRASCRAASGSGLPSHGRWRPGRTCSSATRSPRGSTSRFRRRCSAPRRAAIRSRAGAPLHHPRPRRGRCRRRPRAGARARRRARARDGRGRDRAPAGRLRDGSSRRLPACPRRQSRDEARGADRLEDVAREAGVAKSTASRILNGTPGMTVRPETRQRVLDVARELR